MMQIEMLTFGIFFLLMCAVGYLTITALLRQHEEKVPDDICPKCLWLKYYCKCGVNNG